MTGMSSEEEREKSDVLVMPEAEVELAGSGYGLCPLPLQRPEPSTRHDRLSSGNHSRESST